ncbi:hypothetical protein FS837_000230 [Tulasnella sp. UAMH 9824]|nr:hypothetical protein FS837_000230 [Tulasnella sp. UAMH 9824]
MFKRKEEGPETLKAIALQRTICESDDPETLLHTISNVIALGEPDTMDQLWAQSAFRRRFLEVYRNPSDGVSRLVGYTGSPSKLVESARQLYRGAAAHILLSMNPDWHTSDALQSCANLLSDIAGLDASTILKPTPPLGKPSSKFTRSNLGLFAIWRRPYGNTQAHTDSIGNYLVACSEVLAGSSDRQLLLFFSWIVCWYTAPSTPRSEPVGRITDESRAIYSSPLSHKRRARRTLQSVEIIRSAYTRDSADVARVVQGAFQALVRTESRDLLDCGVVLTNIFRGIERILADEQFNPDANVQHAFELLESCETVLRSPRVPPTAREIGENLRMSVAQLWRREYIARRAGNKSSNELMTALHSYLIHVRSFKRDEYGYDEDIAVERVFGAMLRPISADVSELKGGPAVCEAFSAFVEEVSKNARINARRVRDPDGHWCHWEEEILAFEGTHESL